MTGMSNRPADSRKQRPGNHATVAEYIPLKVETAVTPPSVSKKAIQANRVPVWGWGTEGEKEKAQLHNNKWRPLEEAVISLRRANGDTVWWGKDSSSKSLRVTGTDRDDLPSIRCTIWIWSLPPKWPKHSVTTSLVCVGSSGSRLLWGRLGTVGGWAVITYFSLRLHAPQLDHCKSRGPAALQPATHHVGSREGQAARSVQARCHREMAIILPTWSFLWNPRPCWLKVKLQKVSLAILVHLSFSWSNFTPADIKKSLWPFSALRGVLGVCSHVMSADLAVKPLCCPPLCQVYSSKMKCDAFFLQTKHIV